MAYQFEKLSILVVDDNKPMRELIASMFAIFGCDNIVEAANGEEAFDLFCKHKYDIIVTDWRMGPIDGLELLELVRTDPASPNPFVPVLMVTGYSELKRVLAARDTGTTEFLAKPFSAYTLYKRVVEIIEKPRQFVRADTFFGPDRRRIPSHGYKGPFKRESDVRPQDYKTNNNFDVDIIYRDAF